MLGEITRGLLRLPLELHSITVARPDRPSKGSAWHLLEGRFQMSESCGWSLVIRTKMKAGASPQR